ncbi:epididymal secretory glutathione peroxidase [Patella vulgata]|uniref:epididymal secretory glutathione peroxidase n=1 Tax=Patella vulgata TaxID=6465 RepID=UPI0021808614|nr:epididymal secretory glutathione peroxidase [Patella vulgata]
MNAILLRLDALSIVGFPCNQFGHQEPADNSTELYNGLRYVRPGSGYVPSFDVMKKIDVNGKKEAPLYTFLKESCQPPSKASFNKFEMFSDPIKPHDITWNFEKFLIDDSGRPVFRFLPPVEPNDLVDLIRKMASGSATTAQLKRQLLKIDKINKDRAAKVEKREEIEEIEEEKKENNA